jgi:hypothetical protein
MWFWVYREKIELMSEWLSRVFSLSFCLFFLYIIKEFNIIIIISKDNPLPERPTVQSEISIITITIEKCDGLPEALKIPEIFLLLYFI